MGSRAFRPLSFLAYTSIITTLPPLLGWAFDTDRLKSNVSFIGLRCRRTCTVSIPLTLAYALTATSWIRDQRSEILSGLISDLMCPPVGRIDQRSEIRDAFWTHLWSDSSTIRIRRRCGLPIRDDSSSHLWSLISDPYLSLSNVRPPASWSEMIRQTISDLWSLIDSDVSPDAWAGLIWCALQWGG